MTILLIIVLAYVVLGTLLVAGTFYFAFYYSPRHIFACDPATAPYAGREPPPKLLSAFLMEAPRALVLIAVRPLYPLLGRTYAVRRRRRQPVGAPPVVLVHGYMMTRTNWLFFMPMLARRGVPGPFYTFNYNTLHCVERSAAKLAAFVERVAREWQTDKVDLISHSWGGVVCRWYVEKIDGHTRVRRLVQLAPTNQGTGSCFYALGCPGYEGAIGARVVRELGPPPADVSYTVIWSTCDQSIIPPECARLEPYPRPPGPGPIGTTAEVRLDNIGHLTELWYGRVADEVARRLTVP